METLKPLSLFFTAIANDGRISITHIGIYAALLQFRAGNGFINPINIYCHQVMGIAKISSKTTLLKGIRELSEYGYIRYRPSRKRNYASEIYFPD